MWKNHQILDGFQQAKLQTRGYVHRKKSDLSSIGYVCMCICICIYEYVYVNIYVYVYMHIYICTLYIYICWMCYDVSSEDFDSCHEISQLQR